MFRRNPSECFLQTWFSGWFPRGIQQGCTLNRVCGGQCAPSATSSHVPEESVPWALIAVVPGDGLALSHGNFTTAQQGRGQLHLQMTKLRLRKEGVCGKVTQLSRLQPGHSFKSPPLITSPPGEKPSRDSPSLDFSMTNKTLHGSAPALCAASLLTAPFQPCCLPHSIPGQRELLSVCHMFSLSLASGPLHVLPVDSELSSSYILLVRAAHPSGPLVDASFSKKLSRSLSWS